MPVTINGSTGLTGVAAIDSVSSTELGYVDGLTEPLSTSLAAKAPSASPTFTGTVTFTGATVVGLPVAGLTLITAQTFSAASSVNVNGCFTSTYENYLVIVRHVGSVTNAANMRLRVSGVDSVTGYYGGGSYTTWAASLNALGANNATQWDGPAATTTDHAVGQWWLTNPATASNTQMNSFRANHDSGAQVQGSHKVATAYDGFSIVASSGTITGTVRVYGLKKD